MITAILNLTESCADCVKIVGQILRLTDELLTFIPVPGTGLQGIQRIEHFRHDCGKSFDRIIIQNIIFNLLGVIQPALIQSQLGITLPIFHVIVDIPHLLNRHNINAASCSSVLLIHPQRLRRLQNRLLPGIARRLNIGNVIGCCIYGCLKGS